MIVNQTTKIYPLNNQTGKNNKQYYYVTLNFFLLTIIVTQNVMHTVYFIIINDHLVYIIRSRGSLSPDNINSRWIGDWSVFTASMLPSSSITCCSV